MKKLTTYLLLFNLLCFLNFSDIKAGSYPFIEDRSPALLESAPQVTQIQATLSSKFWPSTIEILDDSSNFSTIYLVSPCCFWACCCCQEARVIKVARNENEKASLQREKDVHRLLKSTNTSLWEQIALKIFASGTVRTESGENCDYITMPRVTILTEEIEDQSPLFSSQNLDHQKTIRSANTWESIKKLGLDLLRALEVLHGNKVYHRDIKPQNVFYNPKTNSYGLLDFGLAKHPHQNTSGDQEAAGTPGYRNPDLSPDQYLKQDLWALACTLWEFAFGASLFVEGLEGLEGDYQEEDYQEEDYQEEKLITYLNGNPAAVRNSIDSRYRWQQAFSRQATVGNRLIFHNLLRDLLLGTANGQNTAYLRQELKKIR